MTSFNQNNASLRLCIDCADGGHLCGRVCGQRLRAPMEFSDVGTLVLRLEEVLDAQNFPQAFQRSRTFVPRRAPCALAADTPEEGMPPDEVAKARGKAATLLLYVTSRRSSTWQGRVDWLDGSAPQAFSSVLDLIGLLDEHFQR